LTDPHAILTRDNYCEPDNQNAHSMTTDPVDEMANFGCNIMILKNYSQLHNLHNHTIYTKVTEIRLMIHEFTTDGNETGICMG